MNIRQVIITTVLIVAILFPLKMSMAQNNNGIMVTYGDTIFSGMNGLMDTYYIESVSSGNSFNGIRTEFEPQHEKLANGLNGVMDVFDSNAGDLTADGQQVIKQHDAPPIKFQVFYPIEGYQLSPSNIATLEEMFDAIKSDKVKTFYINGYTDPTGPKAYNLMLSKKRAQQVEGWMLSKGIPLEKIRTQGAGIDNEQLDYQKARRVDLIIEIK